MSNVIPPLLSSSPPPMVGVLDDEEDDEFGDFVVATNLAYGCDGLSLPASPQKEINKSISNHCQHDCDLMNVSATKNIQKDFQDKRKAYLSCDYGNELTLSSESCAENHAKNVTDDIPCNSSKIISKVDNKYNTFQYFPEVPPDLVLDDCNDVDDKFGPISSSEESDEFQDFEIGDEVDVQNLESNPNVAKQISHGDVLNTDNFINKIVVNVDHNLDDQEFVETPLDELEKCAISDVNLENAEASEDNTESLECSGVIDGSEESIIKELPLEKENEFGDFDNYNSETAIQIVGEEVQLQLVAADVSKKDVDTTANDEFGNFETSHTVQEVHWDVDPFSNVEDIDFSTESFGDFNNQAFENSPAFKDDVRQNNSDDDEFGDFNDYSVQAQPIQYDASEKISDTKQLHRLLSINIEIIPQRAQAIILEMFPVVKQLTEDYSEEELPSDDMILGNLKDVTDTCALLYQWSKSNGQNCLLKALNIDTRNILYGPRWNETMPRYAATLGFTPLEPVKSDVLVAMSPEPSSLSLSSSQTPSNESSVQVDIPSAQFDWVSSGLTNPLENSPASTMLLDLEQLVASLDIQFSSSVSSKSPNSPSPVNDIDDWEFWLRLTPKKVVEKRDSLSIESKIHNQDSDIFAKGAEEADAKTTEFEFTAILQPEVGAVVQSQSDSGSVKSLQLEMQPEDTTQKTENVEIGFDDFTSFQSPPVNDTLSNFNWSFNTVPLRETYISGSSVKIEKQDHNLDCPGWLQPTIVTPDLPRKTTEKLQDENGEVGFIEYQVNDDCVRSENVDTKLNSTDAELETKQPEPAPNSLDDDEFTDFQSTLPNPSPKPSFVSQAPLQPLPVMLEPLRPSVVQPAVMTSINWPDPGITDDDLICIELNYKPKSLHSKSGVIKENETCKPGNEEDDDDWSDFISSEEASASQNIGNNTHLPAKSATSQLKQLSRTSTPELPLSVPHLHQIQPPKKPVPVVTQQGLIQTKLPTDSLLLPSIQQPKLYPQTTHAPNGFQPSLISNQFAVQFGQGLACQNFHQTRPLQLVEPPIPAKQISVYNPQQDSCNGLKVVSPSVQSKIEELDDEWTDFVSSQPAPLPAQLPPISNGLHKNLQPRLNLDWNRPPQFTSWSTNVTPNIITNPVSFDSFQSYTSPASADLLRNKTASKRSSSKVVQSRKSTIPSISAVPDLEFIAPKSRTWKK